MEGKGLKVLNLQMSDMARQIENAIQFGSPVLLQDVMEEIDPVLEPVLAKVGGGGGKRRTGCYFIDTVLFLCLLWAS